MESQSQESSVASDMPSEIFFRKVRHLFRIMEVTGDGILNEEDMTAIAERMKISAKMTDCQAESLTAALHKWWHANMAAIGKPGQSLNEQDFITMRLLKWNAPEEEAKNLMRPNLELFFKAIDADGDGIISPKEWAHYFQAIYPRCYPGESDEAFRIMDTNQDGELSFEEFYNHMFDFLYSQVESPSMYMFGKVP